MPLPIKIFEISDVVLKVIFVKGTIHEQEKVILNVFGEYTRVMFNIVISTKK